MKQLECIPTTWDSARDDAFFRIVNRVLPARMLEAATSLLLENDSELTSY